MEPDYSVIGKRIKQLRVAQELTQEQLAAKLDFSVAFLSRVERGRAKINLARLVEIASILRVEPSYLLSGSNEDSKNYLDREFHTVLEKCSPEQQKFIYQVAELVANSHIAEKKTKKHKGNKMKE